MSDYSTEIQQLIETVRVDNPSLYTALSLLNQQIFDLNIQLNPLVIRSIEAQVIATTIAPPTSFTFSIPGFTLRLQWSEAEGASFYEIRVGSSWNTASLVLRTSSLQADIDPLLIGTYTYLIKSVSSTGAYSDAATSLSIVIPTIAAPTISAQVVDNNVLLSWTTPPSSFAIDYFSLYRDDSPIGRINGNFTTVFELLAGNYVYKVIAVDIAGNLSNSGSLQVAVNAPPDFVLQDTRVSALGGTRTNVILDPGPKLIGSYVVETWEDHFVNHGWNSIDDQIAAGYPVYLQPANITGSYEEVIDYGGAFTSLIISVVYNYRLLTGVGVAIIIKMAVSLDNITYSAFTSGSVQYFTSFRYLKLRLELTAVSDKALVEITNLTTRLDVKREQDGGIAACLSTDAGGTTVNFNKTFRDIDSVTATPMGTTDRKAIIDFTDVPNPTSFKILLFDNAGARASGDARWLARGIL